MATRDLLRRLRLWAGAVLFAYVTTHLLNHAVGLISLTAMEQGAELFQLLWRSPPAVVALYGAFILHVGLVFWSFYLRRSLKLSTMEWVQAGLGVSIVPLGALHFIGTAVAHSLYGLHDSYSYVLWATWSDGWVAIIEQFGLVLVAWIHGCIGLHMLWRLKPGYRRYLPLAYGVALMLPTLAVVAYFQRGEEVARLSADPTWMRNLLQQMNLPSQAATDKLVWAVAASKWAFGTMLLGVLGARLLRDVLEQRRAAVRLRYPQDVVASGPAGPSILEFSRRAGIPHASVCGGRGRCSTCRVRIGRGRELLAPPSPAEQKVLTRVGAPANVRLACQVHPPPGDYDVTPLLPATAQARDGFARGAHHHGEEREIAVMFCDIRGFTTLAESKLPYDTVFVLNRYFRSMGEAIEQAGGHVDKFIGDGVMALFGLEGDRATASRQALDAARRMALALDQLNISLSGDLDQPLRIGIGAHTGVAIVGELGYGATRALTAIGDTVNTASRLEALTKEYGSELIVSEDLVQAAGCDLGEFPAHEISVRGRSQPLVIRAVADAALLPELPPMPAIPAGRRRRAAAGSTANTKL